ncbi:MAG: HU family DNA-binding protein [candidate division Zixibacteria bacterium]|nr:HU family DNA-binding protein [candidate division Zixibacteria bacterium]
MTKEEIAQKMAYDAGISKRQAVIALQSFMDNVADSLKQGKKVSLVGFGVFVVSRRKARVGRHPRTGTRINIPAMKVPHFRAGKSLKKAVRK